jgi:hypothetical protein
LSKEDTHNGGSVGNWGGQTGFDAIKGQLAGEAWEMVKVHSYINVFQETIFIVGSILPQII